MKRKTPPPSEKLLEPGTLDGFIEASIVSQLSEFMPAKNKQEDVKT